MKLRRKVKTTEEKKCEQKDVKQTLVRSKRAPRPSTRKQGEAAVEMKGGATVGLSV